MAKQARAGRLVLVLALLALGGVVLLGVLGYAFLPRMLLDRIEAEAAARGVTLDRCELRWSMDRIVLERCEFRLERSTAVSGTIRELTIALDGFAPARVDVEGAVIQVRDSPDFDELFAKHKPQLGPELPVTVTGSELYFWRAASDKALLHLTSLEYRAPEGSLSANVNVSDRAKGKLTRNGDLVELSLSLDAHPEAKLHARIQQGKALGELRVEVQRIRLADLSGPLFAITPLLEPVEADLQLYAHIPIGLEPTPPKGDFRATLRGLNFPVPLELQGLVYGTPVELDGAFTLDRSFTKAKLEKLRLSVGALRMRGTGKAELVDQAIAFETSWSGALPCAAIVRSAAAAHVDSELAKVAGRIARQALDGAVTLVAFVKGRSDQLERAQVIESVGVGCGLKPLPLPDLTKLPRELLDQLPKLDELLPPDRREPPKLELPKLPTLPFPRRRELQDRPSEPGAGERTAPGHSAPTADR